MWVFGFAFAVSVFYLLILSFFSLIAFYNCFWVSSVEISSYLSWIAEYVLRYLFILG